MQRRVSYSFLIFILIFLGVTSCHIETARPEKRQALVIASDFLHEKDTLIFAKFIKENDIQIIIRHLSVSEIISEVKRKKYNSEIDMIFSQNMQSSIELNKSGILQNLIQPEEETKSQNKYISYKHNFVGFGLDPFVFKYTHDSIRQPQNYEDLVNHVHSHTLSKSDLVSFLSPIRKKKNRAQTYEWAKKWNKKSTVRPERTASRDSSELVLCKYSQLETFKDSTWMDYSEGHFFPNQNQSGVYFDLMTMSIVEQAEHFSDAQKLMTYCQNPGFNTFINRKLNRFPIYDYLSVRSEGPQFYSSAIDQLLQYHDVLGRMLDKLD